MSEQKALLELALSCLATGGTPALAAVVAHEGSVPRGSGAMLLLTPDGSTSGTVGGGSLELKALEELRQVCKTGCSRLLQFQLLPERDGMPCGGSVTLLLARLDCAVHQALSEAVDSLAAGRSYALEGVVFESGDVCWGRTLSIAARGVRFCIPLQPAPRLLICGAGHIAQALAPMALSTGFTVAVLDDRPDLLTNSRFPSAVETVPVPSFADCLQTQPLTPANLLLIATYGHLHDRIVLEQALATEVGYIGMVGSRRKREELFGMLRANGVSDTDLLRVRCPVGLTIGAETPAEIAVSILAEMIAFRRGKG